MAQRYSMNVGDVVIVKATGQRALISAVLPQDRYQVEYLPDPAEDPIERDSSISGDQGGVYLMDDLQVVE